MPIRTAEQYLDSLRDDREVYIGGDRVKDVTKDARFAGAAETPTEAMTQSDSNGSCTPSLMRRRADQSGLDSAFE